MKQGRQIAKRLGAMLLSIAVVLPLFQCMVGHSGDAEAAVSLPKVEDIKYSGKLLSVLEIVPTEGSGCLGYYVAGQEPDWRAAAAGLVGADARKNYVDGLFSSLSAKRVLGSVGSEPTEAPLKKTGDYEEKYPWEISETEKSNYSILQLEKAESKKIKGQFADSTDGEYELLPENVQLGSANGVHVGIVQIADYYMYYDAAPAGESLWWYKLSFTEITSSEATVGTTLYLEKTIEDRKIYIYAGKVGEDGFAPESSVKYYKAAYTQAPQTARSDEFCYAAVSPRLRLAAEGDTTYFYVQKNQLKVEYVGVGGNVTINPSKNNQQITVTTKTVYYKGGYENNNWFWRYVLDWTDGEPEPTVQVQVKSVVGNQVTAEQVTAAELIVLSRGFNKENYSDSSDISAEVKDKILELCKPALGRRIVIDSNLINVAFFSSKRVETLADELADRRSTERVEKNIYCAPYLLTGNFNKDIGANSTQWSPFYSVFYTIKIENERRASAGISPLEYRISIATIIRHLLNDTVSGGGRTVRVLSIEPGKTPSLTENTVKDWLGTGGLNTYSIDIKYVSTAQLVGMTEDICEEYDLIYIGSNISDFKTKTEENGNVIRDYADDNMDGMVYTNIGDLVVSGGDSGWSLSGLLDRDYDRNLSFTSRNGKSYNPIETGNWQSPFTFQSSDVARTFRYSGNDLTAEKTEEIKDFVKAGFPVVIAGDLSADWYEMSSASVNSGLAQFEMRLPLSGERIAPQCSFTVSIEANAEKNSLTATWENLDVGALNYDAHLTSAKYVWYRIRENEKTEIHRSDATGSKSNTLVLTGSMEPQSGDKYYCELVPDYMYAYWIFNSGDFINAKNAVSETVTLNKDVFDASVDNSSYMYELLSSINTADYGNVMKSGDINSTALSGYVTSIKHPEISFKNLGTAENPDYACPVEYSMGDDGTSTSLQPDPTNGKYSLDYTFTVGWRYTTTTEDTEFTAKLYTDLNGDGRYTDDELLSEKTNIKLNMEYNLSVPLTDMAGIIPWRLEIEQTGSPYVRCAREGYTHITPDEKPTVNVLQINTSRTTKSLTTGEQVVNGLDLQANIENGGTFYNLLFEKDENGDDISKLDFVVNVITVRASELDGLAGKYQKYCADPNLAVAEGDEEKLVQVLRADKGNSCGSLSELLDSFDMLMMGFDDCYQQISADSSKAICKYINSGKATLFSHDNTSFFFLPSEDYQLDRGLFESWNSLSWFKRYVYAPEGLFDQLSTAWMNDFSAFGYDFNMTIRDAVGLDRYGVTSQNIVSSEGYLTIDNDRMLELIRLGYSIAYKPGSNRTKTVAETQGLTNGILTRYYKSGGYPTNNSYNSSGYEKATQITQLNKGQITTYPYNINTAEFGGTADVVSGTPSGRISIGETHVQYDQLNLNSSDIVVWYCLAGGEFDYMPNDAMNAYYIYNRRNVTYTGFGHTTDPINDNEAKLLINTIIAAYRSNSELHFTDAGGTKDLESFLIPSDGDELLTSTYAGDPDRRVYFTIGGAADSRTSVVEFFLEGHEEALEISIYDQANGARVTGVSGGNTYYIRLDDVLELLPDTGIQTEGLKLIAKLNGKAADTLTLRKLSLFNLS